MPSNRSFCSAIRLLIVLTCLLYLDCQIVGKYNSIHRPVILKNNHRQWPEFEINLNFEITSQGKKITMHRGNSFLIKFPDGTFDIGINPKCAISNNNQLIDNISTERDIDSSIVYCIANNLFSINGVELSDVTIKINDIKTTGNFYRSISVGLYTSKSNGILLVSHPSFKSVANYINYKKEDNSSFVKIVNLSVKNLTPNSENNCLIPTPSCTKLYPLSDYSLTANIFISSFFDPQETLLCFLFKGIIPDKILVSSSAYIPSDATQILNPLYRKLSSSSGDLLLKNLGGGHYCFENISQKIEKSEIFQFINGRKFNLTFEGFKTGEFIGKALETITTYVKWKNANSYLSYYPQEFLIDVNQYKFKAASETDSDIKKSVLNYEDGSSVIYENGSFPLKFSIRIPRTSKGFLKVEHISTQFNVFSFYASTCDFSDDKNLKNVFGSRPLCYPTYNAYSNKLTRNMDTTTNNNSAIKIPFDGTSLVSTDLIFSIWGYSNKCTDSYIDSQSSKFSRKDSLMDSNDASFQLRFKYSYTIETDSGNLEVASEEFNSELRCHKTIRGKEYLNGSDDEHKFKHFYVENTSYIQDDLDTANSKKNDALLYQEFYDWNAVSVTHSPNAGIATYDKDLKYLNQLNTPNTTYLSGIYAAVNPWDLPLPYGTNKKTNNSIVEYSTKLHPGKFSFYLSPTVSEKAINDGENCKMVWFNKDLKTQTFFYLNTTGLENKHKLTLDKFSLTTTVVNHSDLNLNGSNMQAQNILNYLDTTTLAIKTDWTDFALTTDCFKFKHYKDLSITNLYTSISFYYKYDRFYGEFNGGNSNFKTSRVARFFKLFNSKLGYNSGITGTAKSDTTFWMTQANQNIFSGNSQLCILELSSSLMSSLQNQSNILLVTLLDQRLPQVEIGQYYPISQAIDGVKAQSLESEEGNTSSLNAAKIPMSLVDMINGSIQGKNDDKAPSFYFGSSIIIYGFTVGIVTKSDSNLSGGLLIPLHCPTTAEVFGTIQTFQQNELGAINKDNSKILKLQNSNLQASWKTIFNTFNASNNTITNLNISFRPYNTVATVENGINLNQLNVLNSNGINKFYTLFFLTNNVETTDLNAPTNILFDSVFIQSHIMKFKLNGIPYDRAFFSKPAAVEIGTSDFVNFYKRPSQNTSSTLKIHGLGVSDGSPTTAKYFTNSGSLVKDPEQINPILPKITDKAIDCSLESIDSKIYANDFGLNVEITCTVFSNVSTYGVLTVDADGIKSNTICVDSLNYSLEYKIDKTTITRNVIVKENEFNVFKISCFNWFVSGTTFTSRIQNTSTKFISDYNKAILNLTPEYTKNFSTGGTPDNVTTIKPDISSINYSQVYQEKGLAVACIQIDLKRPLRIGQTIELIGPTLALYTGSKRPRCEVMINESSSCNFNMNQSSQLISSCSYTEKDDDNDHTITIKTGNYIPFFKERLPSKLTIRLTPVYAKQLSSSTYYINTYLNNDQSTTIASKDKVDLTKPYTTISFNKTFEDPLVLKDTGLCDLKSINNRIPTLKSEYNFEINLNNLEAQLKTFNSEGEKKVVNEISIFFDPFIYSLSPITCLIGILETPCEWNIFGFINIKFREELKQGNHKISIRGIINPIRLISDGNLEFLCSVNYFANDTRENLIVGKGSNTITTYSATTNGNLIFYNHPNGMVSDQTPRETSTHNFRFNIDSTANLSQIENLFVAIGNNKVTLMVIFPDQYDIVNSNEKITATLSYVTFNNQDEKVNVSYNSPINISVITFPNETVNYNFIKIYLELNPFEITKENAYFDLILKGIPNPKFSGNTNDIAIYILNDFENPSMIFGSYTNLNNSKGEKSDFDNFFLGPKFDFTNNTIGLIEADNYNIVMKPGRYMNFGFVLTGSNANVSTDLTLSTSRIFGSIEDKISLSTAINNTMAKIQIGTSCDTLPGCYWASFNLSNQKDFYKLAPIRVCVTPVAENQELIRTTILPNSNANVSLFTMAAGGFRYVYLSTNLIPFKQLDIKIEAPETNTNNNTFQFTKDTINIQEKTKSSYFRAQISNASSVEQKVSLSITNKCFTFEEGKQVFTKNINFKLSDSLASISSVKLLDKMEYISTGMSNEIGMKFKAPIKNTLGYFALICSQSDFPKIENLEDKLKDIDNYQEKQGLVSFKKVLFNDDSDMIIAFSNLQRGITYKLRACLLNYAIIDRKPNCIDTLVLNNTNLANTTLSTPDQSGVIYYEIQFENVPNPRLLDRMYYILQKMIISSTGSNIIVSNEKNITSKGYIINQSQKCSAISATEVFGAKLTEQQKTDEEVSFSIGNQIQTNSKTTNRDANDLNNNRLLQNKEIKYANINFIVFYPDPNEPMVIDIEAEVRKQFSNFDTPDKFNSIFATSEFQLNGNFMIFQKYNDRLLSNSFAINDWKYVNGQYTFFAIGPYELTCQWKLNPKEKHFTKNEILDCNKLNESANGETCGNVVFLKSPTEKINLKVGNLAAGKYFVEFFCKSPLPNSSYEIVFYNKDQIIIEPAKIEKENTEQVTDPCITNPNAIECKNSSSQQQVYMVLLILIFALFDF